MTALAPLQVEALALVVAADGPVTAARVVDALHVEGERWTTSREVAVAMARLLREGGIRRVQHGRYEPTERGRIAMAMEMLRRPGIEAAFFDEGATEGPGGGGPPT